MPLFKCRNYKSPKQLGLRICTSDIPCYDGQGFECIELPSNPSLNQVLKAIDLEFCALLELINNIALPNEPWENLVDGLNVISKQFQGKEGTTLVGDESSIQVRGNYHVLSPNAIAVGGTIDLTVDIDPTAEDYDGGGFQIDLAYEAIESAIGGWFNPDLKIHSNGQFSNVSPTSVLYTAPSGSEGYFSGHAVYGSTPAVTPDNEIQFFNIFKFTEAGQHSLTIFFNAVIGIREQS